MPGTRCVAKARSSESQPAEHTGATCLPAVASVSVMSRGTLAQQNQRLVKQVAKLQAGKRKLQQQLRRAGNPGGEDPDPAPAMPRKKMPFGTESTGADAQRATIDAAMAAVEFIVNTKAERRAQPGVLNVRALATMKSRLGMAASTISANGWAEVKSKGELSQKAARAVEAALKRSRIFCSQERVERQALKKLRKDNAPSTCFFGAKDDERGLGARMKLHSAIQYLIGTRDPKHLGIRDDGVIWKPVPRLLPREIPSQLNFCTPFMKSSVCGHVVIHVGAQIVLHVVGYWTEISSAGQPTEPPFSAHAGG